MGMCKECGVVFPAQDMTNGYCKEHAKNNNGTETKTNNVIEVQNIEGSAVVVTDIKMSFMSMVVFMVKWVIASIPAFIILMVLAMIVGGIVGGGVGVMSIGY